MMVRVLAFARHAHESLAFSKGLSTEDEPDLWQKDLTADDIELWIDLGQPRRKRIRRACGPGARAKRSSSYTYSGNSADILVEQKSAARLIA